MTVNRTDKVPTFIEIYCGGRDGTETHKITIVCDKLQGVLK